MVDEGAGPPESLRAALEAIAEHKGEDVVVLDMREVTSFTDWLVVCNGRNPRQNQAIADAVAEAVGEHDRRPNSVEGRGEGTWILADYVDFVVNVFAPETREFYQLERLWRDAPAYAPADGGGLEAVRRSS